MQSAGTHMFQHFQIPQIIFSKQSVRKMFSGLSQIQKMAYSSPQIKVLEVSRDLKIMNIYVFVVLIRQIWIGPVPREAEECHLQFVNIFAANVP